MGTGLDNGDLTAVERMWKHLAKLTKDYIEARGMWNDYAHTARTMRVILNVIKQWPVPDTDHVAWLEEAIMICEAEANDWEGIMIVTGADMDKLNDRIQRMG